MFFSAFTSIDALGLVLVTVFLVVAVLWILESHFE
jgi:hypothetical protein